MSARRPTWGLALALLLWGCGEAAPAPPNVLFIVIDTLRADHMSTYGYPWETTPRMDELGARGAVFLDNTSQSSWTMPSMMSLLTSHPIFHTIWRLPDGLPVIGEHFQQAGYRTAAFVANSVLHHDNGYARGFDVWDVRAKSKRQWRASDVNRRAYEFLEGRQAAEDPEQPWFLWLHYLDPHHPYEPPVRKWQRDMDTVFSPAELATIDRVIAEAPDAEREFLRTQRDKLFNDVDNYDSEIAFTDAQIGELLDRLAADGLLDNTLVVIVADHGETLYARPEHPEKLKTVLPVLEARNQPLTLSDYLQDEHGYWLYEELIHTPFLVAGHGVLPGQRIDAMVSNLDVVPTVIELAGLPPLPGASGRSLAGPLRTGSPVPPAEIVVSACYENRATKTPDGIKVICPPEQMMREYGFGMEVYDLNSDPDERAALPADPEAHRLCKYLRDAREVDVFREFSADQELDAETRRRLCEMGYIECN